MIRKKRFSAAEQGVRRIDARFGAKKKCFLCLVYRIGSISSMIVLSFFPMFLDGIQLGLALDLGYFPKGFSIQSFAKSFW